MTPPLTSTQKADAWDHAATVLESHVDGFALSPMMRHILHAVVPHLRAMAKRIRGRARKRP
jgi:hypothetical protein